MIKALIVDDEQPAREVLNQLIQDFCPNIKIIGEAKDTFEAEELILELKPELLFLDVEMPGRNGLQFLKDLPSRDFRVIFTTAYSNYAIEAIRFSALDYLVKPISIPELIQAVHRCLAETDQGRIENLVQNEQQLAKKIALPHAEGVDFVELKEIVYAEADGSYCRLNKVNGQQLLLSRNLKYLEQQLADERFLRCHKSFLVNLEYVVRLDKDGNLGLQNEVTIPLTARTRSEIMKLISKA